MYQLLEKSEGVTTRKGPTEPVTQVKKRSNYTKRAERARRASHRQSDGS